MWVHVYSTFAVVRDYRYMGVYLMNVVFHRRTLALVEY